MLESPASGNAGWGSQPGSDRQPNQGDGPERVHKCLNRLQNPKGLRVTAIQEIYQHKSVLLQTGCSSSVKHLKRFVCLPLLQQVKQMFSLELQSQLIWDSVELCPLCTQGKLLQNKIFTKIKPRKISDVFYSGICKGEKKPYKYFLHKLSTYFFIIMASTQYIHIKKYILTLASSIFDKTASEFNLDSDRSSCHVAHGNGGFNVSICKRKVT